MTDRSHQLRMCRDALDVPASATVYSFFVPGRIEVFGKHTDYAGGRSLLAAVDRGFVITARARSDERIRIIDVATSESAELTTELPADSPLWVRYPEAVVRRMSRNFPDARGGADIAFISDLPAAAGLSSSSALVVAVFMALGAVRGVASTEAYRGAIHSSEDLAGYLGAVENGLDFAGFTSEAGVGTHGGSEDHTAILCAREDAIVQYSFLPVRFEREVRMPDGFVFVIAATGVRAEKAGAALTEYNRLSAQTRALAQLWRDAGAGTQPTLGAILASDYDAAQKLRSIATTSGADDNLLDRLAQFAAETSELIPAAARAFGRGDVTTFGDLAWRSHLLAETALLNQVPETSALVRMARNSGAAASAFGAGFGGSVWALVHADDAASFQHSWQSQYLLQFPQHARSAAFFTSTASTAAVQIS